MLRFPTLLRHVLPALLAALIMTATVDHARAQPATVLKGLTKGQVVEGFRESYDPGSAPAVEAPVPPPPLPTPPRAPAEPPPVTPP